MPVWPPGNPSVHCEVCKLGRTAPFLLRLTSTLNVTTGKQLCSCSLFCKAACEGECVALQVAQTGQWAWPQIAQRAAPFTRVPLLHFQSLGRSMQDHLGSLRVIIHHLLRRRPPGRPGTSLRLMLKGGASPCATVS